MWFTVGHTTKILRRDMHHTKLLTFCFLIKILVKYLQKPQICHHPLISLHPYTQNLFLLNLPPLLFIQAPKYLVSSYFFNYHLIFKLVHYLLTYIRAKISPLRQHRVSTKKKKEEVKCCLMILKVFWSCMKQGLKCF